MAVNSLHKNSPFKRKNKKEKSTKLKDKRKLRLSSKANKRVVKSRCLCEGHSQRCWIPDCRGSAAKKRSQGMVIRVMDFLVKLNTHIISGNLQIRKLVKRKKLSRPLFNLEQSLEQIFGKVTKTCTAVQ